MLPSAGLRLTGARTLAISIEGGQMSSYLDRFRADGKVAVVTGASSGLGAGFARALGSVGASVVVAARRADRLDELCAALTSDGIAAHRVVMDVTDPDQCEELVRSAVSRFGSLDILVNNAGVGGSVPSHKEAPDHFRNVVDVNLMGTYWMAQAAVHVMGPGSAIVNIASLHGVTASRFPQAAYSASKAGVLGLTRDLASQWSQRRGIRVNALCPGYVETEMTSEGIVPLSAMVEQQSILGRLGRQEEMDSALIFLATDASSYMTGSTVMVDGGYSVV